MYKKKVSTAKLLGIDYLYANFGFKFRAVLLRKVYPSQQTKSKNESTSVYKFFFVDRSFLLGYRHWIRKIFGVAAIPVSFPIRFLGWKNDQARIST